MGDQQQEGKSDVKSTLWHGAPGKKIQKNHQTGLSFGKKPGYNLNSLSPSSSG
jgi:hypothetical protein